MGSAPAWPRAGTRRARAPTEEGTEARRRTVAEQTSGRLTRERLPRRARLALSSELRATLRHGRRYRLSHLELVWKPNQLGHPRVGVIVSRHQRSAVARNRLRRRLRELLRRSLLPRLPAVDLIVCARREAYDASFEELQSELCQLDLGTA